MSNKIKISAHEAAFLVSTKIIEDDALTKNFIDALRAAKESGNAVTIDLRHYGITDTLLLQAHLWTAAFEKVKVVIQPLPSSFVE